MCKGKTVYHGPQIAMLPYLNQRGYPCELHDNPADFALDVLIRAKENNDQMNKLYSDYCASRMHATIISELEPLRTNTAAQKLSRKTEGAPGRPFHTELFYLSQRTFLNAIRNPALFLSQIVVALILGFLVGLVFYNMDQTVDTGVQNRLGAIFFIVVCQIFSTVTALEPLLKERVLFIHVNTFFFF